MTKIHLVNEALRKEYGHHRWEPRLDPTSSLILTILSQHTSDVNSWRAFQSLTASFSGWSATMEADPATIATAIRSGGLADVKAVRIKEALRQIWERRGSFDLSFLRSLDLDEAKAWLRSLPGVGPKTAAIVLLFSLGCPALPVDTHVFRVAKRLGLLPGVNSPDKAHEVLERELCPDEVYDFHVNMIAHGRRICKAQRPRCPHCVLFDLCDSGPVFVARGVSGP